MGNGEWEPDPRDSVECKGIEYSVGHAIILFTNILHVDNNIGSVGMRPWI
jgi:hypothetical protein